MSVRYAASLVMFFFALFSKQNTITLGPALVAYDFFIGRRFPFRWGSDRRTFVAGLWACTWPYLPFAAMTIGYLYLRYAIFGEVARESQLAQGAEFFGWVVKRHLRRLFLGEVMPGARLQWVGIVAALGMLLALIRWGRATKLGSTASPVCIWGALLYWGPVWLFLGIAPIIVANYESPRHVYLASLGWAMVLGIVMQVLWQARPQRLLRPVALGAAAALLALHAAQLHTAVARWNTLTTVSKKRSRTSNAKRSRCRKARW